jgi:hypothetical protein
MSRNAVCVAADVNGQKINLQFFFDQYGPSTAQVLARAHDAFQRVYDSHGVNRTFAVSHAVVFNDYAQTWDRLERSAQLTHNCQVYLFQPDTLDIPGEIPEPMLASQLLAGYQSPSRESYNHYAVHSSPRAAAAIQSSYAPTAYSSPAYSSPSRAQREAVSATYRAGPEIGGPSLLREEREKEDAKLMMPVDAHRDAVRRETSRFTESLSPARTH